MATATKAPPQQQQRAVVPVPFPAGAQKLTEVFVDQSAIVPGAAQQSFGPFNIRAANGYLRYLDVLVEGTGGTLGTGSLSADAPFNFFQSIYLQDGGGTKVFGPLDGYGWFLINAYGGYDYTADPTLMPDYVGTINWTFCLKIPVEVHPHSALGALPNLSGATEWQVGFVVNPSTTIFSVAPTTPPSVRVRIQEGNWAQPTATDISGHPISPTPPLLGTVQRWQSYTDPSLPAGDYLSRFRNPGRSLRTLIYVNRAAAGTRQPLANLPDPVDLSLDGTFLNKAEPIKLRRLEMLRRTRTPAVPDGVIVYFRDDLLHGMAGDGNPAQFLGLTAASRLELHSSGWVGAGSTLQTLFNDVLFP